MTTIEPGTLRSIRGRDHYWTGTRWMPAIQGGTGIEEGAAVAAIAGTVISAAGAIYSGVQKSQQQGAAAKAAERQAEIARQAGAVAESETRDRTRRIMAEQRAQVGASGFDTEGTPLLTLLDTASQSELSALRARYSGEVQAQGLEFQAAQRRLAGSNALGAGLFGAGTTLLTGAARIGGSRYLARNATAPSDPFAAVDY